MSSRKAQLLACLADGRFHSGEDLAGLAGVSRSAVWKNLRLLKDCGLEIDAVRGKGYRLSKPLELFSKTAVTGHLSGFLPGYPFQLEVLFDTTSSNEYLLARYSGVDLHCRGILAEYQTRGRGRGGDAWLTAPASGICLSLGWLYQSFPASLTALSLAAGVAVAESLQEAGCHDVRLKWPNDIVINGAKLGGILIESRGQIASACEVVIGVGINFHLPPAMEHLIDKQVTDLERAMPATVPSRNRLAALLFVNLARILDRFEAEGFAAFAQRWRDLDYTRGKQVEIAVSGNRELGKVIDIDENGLLIMAVDGRMRKFSSGELSLRHLS